MIWYVGWGLECSIKGVIVSPKHFPAQNINISFMGSSAMTDSKGYFKLVL